MTQLQEVGAAIKNARAAIAAFEALERFALENAPLDAAMEMRLEAGRSSVAEVRRELGLLESAQAALMAAGKVNGHV